MLDFDMSPYGGFVWSAYAVSALMLGSLSLRIWWRARQAQRRLTQSERS